MLPYTHKEIFIINMANIYVYLYIGQKKYNNVMILAR